MLTTAASSPVSTVAAADSLLPHPYKSGGGGRGVGGPEGGVDTVFSLDGSRASAALVTRDRGASYSRESGGRGVGVPEGGVDAVFSSGGSRASVALASRDRGASYSRESGGRGVGGPEGGVDQCRQQGSVGGMQGHEWQQGIQGQQRQEGLGTYHRSTSRESSSSVSTSTSTNPLGSYQAERKGGGEPQCQLVGLVPWPAHGLSGMYYAVE